MPPAARSALLRGLNGLVCLYKPPEMTMEKLLSKLSSRLVNDLNAVPSPIVSMTSAVTHDPSTSELTVTTAPALLQRNHLLHGPRFLHSDLVVQPSCALSPFSSGVQIVGIGRRGAKLAQHLERSQLMRVYRLSAQLGRSTLDGTSTSTTALRTSWRHVTHTKIDRLCAALQAMHQRRHFEMAGVTQHSHEAFLLAARGLVRPQPLPKPSEAAEGAPIPAPVIYGIRCVTFEPPVLEFEVHCINETSQYLVSLVNALGERLKSSASCSGIRRIRHGRFVVGANCLLVKEWTLPLLTENIEFCRITQPPQSLRFHQRKFDTTSSE